MRAVQGRVRGSVSSRSSMSTTPSISTSAGPTSHQSRSSRQGKTSADLPSLDFLENEVGLWDAFFSNTRSGSRHGSVLQPDPLPFENYLHGAVARGEGRPHIQVFSQKTCWGWHFWHFFGRTSLLSASSSPRHRSTLLLHQTTILPQVWQSWR